MKTININGKQYEVTGTAPDGLPIIRGYAKTTTNGVDKDGNPIRSVEVKVPSIKIGLAPGKNG